MAPDREVLAQPAITQPALAQPALAQPVVDRPDLGIPSDCKVEAPAEYRREVERAVARSFAWGSVAEGECWSIGTATAESHWRPDAVSSRGYVGIFQLGEAAAEQHGVQDRYDAADNIQGGVRHLAWNIRMWTKSHTPRPRTFREAAKVGTIGWSWGPANSLQVQRTKGCRYYDGCFEHYIPEETRTLIARIVSLVDTGEWYRGPHH